MRYRPQVSATPRRRRSSELSGENAPPSAGRNVPLVINSVARSVIANPGDRGPLEGANVERVE